jgi:hypothetical protein
LIGVAPIDLQTGSLIALVFTGPGDRCNGRTKPPRNEDRAVRFSEWVGFQSFENQRLGDGGPDGIELISVDFQRKVTHRRGDSTGRLAVGNCAPDCALTGVYPRQTPSLTGRHGERPLGGQVVETTAENVLRYASPSLQRTAFQACFFNHSDISPLRINGRERSETRLSRIYCDCLAFLDRASVQQPTSERKIELTEECRVSALVVPSAFRGRP